MIYTIDAIKEKITPIAQKYGIQAMYLFGSYARGDAREDSDIDLLVDTAGTELNSLLSLGALYCDLESALSKKIDLITMNSLEQEARMPSELDFRDNVANERVSIYAVA